MRYSAKITVLLVAVSAIPVAISGLISTTLSTRTVTSESLRLQYELASQVAKQVDAWFSMVDRDLLRARSYLPFDRLKDHELAALLRVPYRQLEYVTAVVLQGDGKNVVPPVYLSEVHKELPSDVQNRPRLTKSDLLAFEQRVHQVRARQKQVAFSAPYRNSAGKVRVAAALAIPSSGWILAVELELSRVQQMLQKAARFGGQFALTDNKGVVVVSSGEKQALEKIPIERLRGDGVYGKGGQQVLSVRSTVRTIDAPLLLAQPLEQAVAAARRLLLYTGGWTALCLVLALGGGLYLSRGVTQPVKRLAAAARRMQQGELDQHVEAEGRDELADLGKAFNEMATAVGQSMTVIRSQRDELQQWNEKLQARVEERTREVQEALEQVIRSQKAGALGELSAGVAHELNNPLASIVLASQLAEAQLKDDDAQAEQLRTIVEQSQRMHQIVQNLLRFAETPENVEQRPIDVASLCRTTLSMVDQALQEGGVTPSLVAPDQVMRIRGNAAELQQVLLHLIYNALRAMPDGGTLRIEIKEVKEAVRIIVADTGSGIPAEQLERVFEPFFAGEKTRTHSPGLGLAVSDRIVREHEGRITVRSIVGEGTEFSLYFPGIREHLHL